MSDYELDECPHCGKELHPDVHFVDEQAVSNCEGFDADCSHCGKTISVLLDFSVTAMVSKREPEPKPKPEPDIGIYFSGNV